MKIMIKCALIFSCLFTCYFTLCGQSQFLCGHELVLEHQEKLFPGYQAVRNQIFNDAHNLHFDNGSNRNDILMVPVIVHIVWNDPGENLHDSLITNQIDILNESYRLQNDNKDELRDIFKPVQADAGIEFVLADIKRVETKEKFSITFQGLPDNVKKSDQGGSACIDPDKFLNIWVCKIQPIPFIGGQVLGYAYPPIGLSNWPAGAEAPEKRLEGVVIDYRAFGRNNPNILTVNGMTHTSFGRTTVHEVGHYLGLRHIWGDGGGLFGGNSCGADDGINDTPNQDQTVGNCNKDVNSCMDTNMEEDLPDMIENYMDYSSELCQNTFTKEQVAVMRGVLMNQRSGLVSTQNEIASIEKVYCYPNPAKEWIAIHGLAENIMNTILLLDSKGTIVRTFYSNVGSNLFTIDDLPSGLYMVQIINDSSSFNTKFIKAN